MADHDKENSGTVSKKATKVTGKKASTSKVASKKRKLISNSSSNPTVASKQCKKSATVKSLQSTNKLSLLVAQSIPMLNRRVHPKASRGASAVNRSAPRAATNRDTLAVKHVPPAANYTNLYSSVKRLPFDDTPAANKLLPPTAAKDVAPTVNRTALSVAKSSPPVISNVSLSAKYLPSADSKPMPLDAESIAKSASSVVNLVPSVAKRTPPAVATNAPPSSKRSALAGATSLPLKKRLAANSFPDMFHVGEKWTFVDCQMPRATGVGDEDLHAHTAAVCYNSRGAIAHGQATQIHYTSDAFKSFSTVESIFDHMGGAKRLSSAEAIKKELMENGPVVSTSFVLSRALMQSGKFSSSFLGSRIDKTHEVVIVGWMMTAAGEFWLVKSLDAKSLPVPIGFGRYEIDTCCLSPIVNFGNVSWQKGTYFDATFSLDSAWMSWPALLLDISSSELEALADCFKTTGLLSAARKGSSFVIRNKNKVAHSRRYRLKELTWNKEKSKWTLYAKKV